MDETILKQLNFIIEIDKMKAVLRRSKNIFSDRNENDAEHSFHIAMMAITLKDYFIDNAVNVDKTIRLLLMHDLVEVYAGDTFCYDKKGYEDKDLRERMAADKLFSLLPDYQGKEFRSYWEEFEACNSLESKFANAVDRLEPFILNVKNNGYTLTLAPVTEDMILDRMAPVKMYLPKLWDYVLENVEKFKKQGLIKP